VKMILKSRKNNRIAEVSTFLILIGLMVGMVACGTSGGATPTKYNLTMAVTPGGSGTATDLTGVSPYAAGTVVNIKAVAAAGYRFVNWTAPAGTFGSATAATTTFTMPAQNVTVTANFEVIPPAKHNLTMAVSPGGSGTATDLTNASPYTAGTVVNIQAIAASGYRFVNWTAPAGTFGNATTATTTFTLPAQNVTITANFVAIYDLTTSSSAGGNVTTPGQGTFTYGTGTVVNLVATPASGYRFVNWTGNVGTIGNASAATPNITMNGDYSITANFVALHGLTTTSTAGGNVTTPGQGTFTYDTGTVVNLVATPASGYRFVNWTGNIGTIGNVNGATTTITMSGDYSINANFVANFMVDAGDVHTVGLKADGTVVAVGDNQYGQCNVGNWSNIVQVATGYYHMVGLKSDGTVVAVGSNGSGQCDVSAWTDIVQVAAGGDHTVGLKADGTVVAVGDNQYGRCNVGGWTNITQVAAGRYHTVGVKADGTAVAVGWNGYGQCNVGGWTEIIQVDAGRLHTVGLKSDGTVVAAGDNGFGQLNVGGWTNITQVAAGRYHTVGVKSDGTVVAVGDNGYGQCNVGGWTGIVQVAAGGYHTVGLKSDGTVVAAGDNGFGQCDVGTWDLN